MSLITAIKTAAGAKGRGWIPNTLDARDYQFNPRGPNPMAELLYRGRKAADRPKLKEYAPFAYDQGASGSCVAQAIKRCIATTSNLIGESVPTLSARGIYKMIRTPDRLDKEDDGAIMRTAARVVARHGAPLEIDCPWSLRKINDPIDAAALLNGFRVAHLRYEYIRETGEAKAFALRAATHDDLCCVIFGIKVPNSFGRHRGENTYVPTDMRAGDGGHAMVIYEIDLENRRALICNSWGLQWGFYGFAWVSLDWLIEHARDVQVTRPWAGKEAA